MTENVPQFAEIDAGDLPAGTVVRYRPDPSRHDPAWCREGMAIADSDGRLFDTYWGSMSEAHRLQPVELDTIEILFNVNDYDELDRYAHGSKAKWETYHPDDRRYVTSQHRLQCRWFVRKGASPDLATQIENAREAVREADEKVEFAKRQAEWLRKGLADLEACVTAPEGSPS